MSADVETLVVGGGVVGLAIAAELARRGAAPLLVEQHARVGMETSSRNSEVVHAGLYYPPGSLKARLCVEGRERLYRFAAENGVTAKRIGKLVVATSNSEVPALEALAATAARNGVDDLEHLDAAAARALEPEVSCVAAFLSPSTGIVDSHGLMLALEGHIQANGGEIALATRAVSLTRTGEHFAVQLESVGALTTLTARTLIVSAGLQASTLSAGLFNGSPYAPPQTHLAKGHYFTLAGRAPFSRLVYPMPPPGGLGVHLTLDTAGAARFGPDVQWIAEASYDFDDPEGERRRTFEREIRRWWPDLPSDALLAGYTGIRPKISRPGEPAADFAIHGPATHGIERLVALFGIESPGLTAALAIARYVAGLLDA